MSESRVATALRDHDEMGSWKIEAIADYIEVLEAENERLREVVHRYRFTVDEPSHWYHCGTHPDHTPETGPWPYCKCGPCEFARAYLDRTGGD